jgi:hypothetical protein
MPAGLYRDETKTNIGNIMREWEPAREFSFGAPTCRTTLLRSRAADNCQPEPLRGLWTVVMGGDYFEHQQGGRGLAFVDARL